MSKGSTTWSPAEMAIYNARQVANIVPHPGTVAAVAREEVLHDAIGSYCRSQGWLYVHSRMDRATTNQCGTWDFIVALPGGVTLWCECKKGREKLSTEQLGFGAWLTKLGHRTVVARSLEDFVRATKDGFTDAMIVAGREG